MTVSILGTRVIRTEDPRFLTTGGVYTDDMRLPGACHVHFVRSAVAHARIRSVDVSAALEAPGVFAAFTGADLADHPLTASFADYSFVSATEVPSFELVDSQTPTSYNPLGAKGIGEAGTIGSTPAVQNAIIDALAHLGVRHIDMPATPQRVWEALRSAAAS